VYSTYSHPIEPRTYQEAVRSDDESKWKAAMDAEYKSLLFNSTWELVALPPGRKTTMSKRVVKIQTKMDGTPEQYTARLVAKGFTQVHGFHYNETFNPAIKHDSIRSIFALVATRDMHMIQYDVRIAFLYGELDEENFMEQPEGYEKDAMLVCRLK
jgi:hypothetical protein